MDFEQLLYNARSSNNEYVQSLEVLEKNLQHELAVVLFHRGLLQEHREYIKQLDVELNRVEKQLELGYSNLELYHKALLDAVGSAKESLRDMEDNFIRAKKAFLKRLPTLD